MRGLSIRFLFAMWGGLKRGRRKGRRDWEYRWKPSRLTDTYLFGRLKQETVELHSALLADDNPEIKRLCANVANFAMMIADWHEKRKNHE